MDLPSETEIFNLENKIRSTISELVSPLVRKSAEQDLIIQTLLDHDKINYTKLNYLVETFDKNMIRLVPLETFNKKLMDINIDNKNLDHLVSTKLEQISSKLIQLNHRVDYSVEMSKSLEETNRKNESVNETSEKSLKEFKEKLSMEINNIQNSIEKNNYEYQSTLENISRKFEKLMHQYEAHSEKILININHFSKFSKGSKKDIEQKLDYALDHLKEMIKKKELNEVKKKLESEISDVKSKFNSDLRALNSYIEKALNLDIKSEISESFLNVLNAKQIRSYVLTLQNNIKNVAKLLDETKDKASNNFQLPSKTLAQIIFQKQNFEKHLKTFQAKVKEIENFTIVETSVIEKIEPVINKFERNSQFLDAENNFSNNQAEDLDKQVMKNSEKSVETKMVKNGPFSNQTETSVKFDKSIGKNKNQMILRSNLDINVEPKIEISNTEQKYLVSDKYETIYYPADNKTESDTINIHKNEEKDCLAEEKTKNKNNVDTKSQEYEKEFEKTSKEEEIKQKRQYVVNEPNEKFINTQTHLKNTQKKSKKTHKELKSIQVELANTQKELKNTYKDAEDSEKEPEKQTFLNSSQEKINHEASDSKIDSENNPENLAEEAAEKSNSENPGTENPEDLEKPKMKRESKSLKAGMKKMKVNKKGSEYRNEKIIIESKHLMKKEYIENSSLMNEPNRSSYPAHNSRSVKPEKIYQIVSKTPPNQKIEEVVQDNKKQRETKYQVLNTTLDNPIKAPAIESY